MLPEFCIWLAGFVDADGTIGAYIAKKTSTDIRLSITNISKTTLDEIQQITKCGAIQPVAPRGPGRSPYAVWTASNRQACHIIKQIYPYLKVKKDQAKVALELMDRIKNRVGRVRGRLSEEEKQYRKSLIDNLKQLKKGGN